MAESTSTPTHMTLPHKELQTIISFDPGGVTGVAMGCFSDSTPLELDDFLAAPYEEFLEASRMVASIPGYNPYSHMVCESFIARSNNEFAPDLAGVRIEGVLDLLYGDRLVKRSRTKKEQVPDAVLKEHGLWKTGTDVEWEDGRDVNDAIIHMLGYVAFDLKHKPTLKKYFKPNLGKVELR